MNSPALGRTKMAYESIDDAFPEAEPGCEPFGERILVQIRSPSKRSAGGILLPEDSQETEYWNTQVAKIISLGPTAFRNRDTLEPWPEGDWCQPGDFVRIPKYGGDLWKVPVSGSGWSQQALFALYRDTNLIGKIIGDPLEVVSYL